MNYDKNRDLLNTLGVTEPFYRNFHADPLNEGSSIEEYLAEINSPALIRAAFGWSNTPEGYDFWERESVRLQRYL